jgi:hypothetical protein
MKTISILSLLLLASAATLFAASSPPSSGLVAWWGAEGNGNDSSGNGHDGMVESGVSYGPGVSGQAFNFSGSQTSRVYLPDNPAFQLTSLSIGAWVKLSQPNIVGAILMRGDNRTGLDPYVFTFGSSGQLLLAIEQSDTVYTELSSPNQLPLNQWVQVTATFDGGTGDMRIYVNGQLDCETFTAARPLLNLDPNYDPSSGIGNASGNLYNFPLLGSLDDVVLYSRALSPAEVASLAVPEPSSLSILCGTAAICLVSVRMLAPVTERRKLRG